MIQRKQTLWFLISALIACLAFVLPFGFKNTTSMSSYNINIRDFDAQSHIVLTLLFGLIIVTNLGTLFLYKNRSLQVKLSIIILMACIGAFAFEIYFSTIEGNSITFGLSQSTLYIGLIIPLLSFIFGIMAMRGVQQDIKLLKETDRLR